jgi:hypothetical protein
MYSPIVGVVLKISMLVKFFRGALGRGWLPGTQMSQ